MQQAPEPGLKNLWADSRIVVLEYDAGFIDTGLAATTSASTERGKFKVPTLRNVELTAPYMHNGSLATLEQENLIEASAEKGEYLLGRLRQIESGKIREVRGLGLMVGVELRQKVTPTLMALMERGILALPAGATVLRLLPPLVISYEELDTVVGAVADALAA